MSYQPRSLRELEELIELYWNDVRGDGHRVGIYRTDEGWMIRYPSDHEAGPLPSYTHAMFALVEGNWDDEAAYREIVGEETYQQVIEDLRQLA